MANEAFDREIINPRERPLSSDINKVASYADLALRETLRLLYGIRRYNLRNSADATHSSSPEQQDRAGFIGDGFQIRFNAGILPSALRLSSRFLRVHSAFGISSSVSA